PLATHGHDRDLARADRPGCHPGADRDGRIQRQQLVPAGVRLRRRVRVLPPARDVDARGRPPGPQRRRARRCGGHRPRHALLPRHRPGGARMSPADNGPSPEPVVDGAGNGAGPDRRLRLGGMALRNGLLIHGPSAWAAAARTADGRIEVSSGPKPAFARGRLGSAPLIRGPLRLAEAFAVVPIARRGLPAARLPIEDPRVLVVALATAVASRGIRRLGRATAASETVIAALGVLPAVMALRDRDLAAYHGVEHKAIGAYERGSFDPADAPKEHERCGSNLILPLLVLSVAGQLLVERLIRNP